MRMVCSIIKSMSMRVGEPVRSNGRASTMVVMECWGSLAHNPGPCSGSLSGAMVICVSSWSRLRAMEAGRSLPVSSLYLPLTVAVSSSYACSHWSLTDSSPCCLPTMSSNRDLTSARNSRSMSSVQNDGRSKPPATSVTWPDPMVSSCLTSSVASGLSASVPAIWVKYSSTSLMRWSFRRDPHAMRSWPWDAGPPSPHATMRGA